MTFVWWIASAAPQREREREREGERGRERERITAILRIVHVLGNDDVVL